MPGSVFGQIRLSEIMYNEPDSRTRLEWIEIYNTEEISIPLSNYLLIVNDDTISFPVGSTIAETSFIVISRQLLSNNGSDSFEGHWGDSSGYWGDYFLEDYQVIDLDFALTNSSGLVALLDIHNGQIDYFTWQSAGLDGHSFERDNLSPASQSWHQCQAQGGSTPGFGNSTVSEIGDFVVNIEPKIISLSSGGQFTIDATLPSGSSLTIEIFDDSGIRRRLLVSEVMLNTSGLTWDGTDSESHRLNPGIYIMLFSLDGKFSKTKTIPVVIAP